VALTALAAIRTEFPSAEDPGPPFYARLEPGFVIQDGNTVAIPFYRLPSCVPPSFNLLNFFDIPGAFFCGLTVQGFDIWRNGPPPADLGPTHSEMRGLGAVPILFLSSSDLTAAKADGILTIGELMGLPSLRVGEADFYRETLHPEGVAQVPTKTIVALGRLAGGGAFQIHVTTGPGSGHISISLP
jgi:hypothetical protein